MHLGTRFKWVNAKKYEGKKLSRGATTFGIWGRGSKGFGKSKKFERIIKSWKKGHLTDSQISGVAARLQYDMARLEFNALMGKSPFKEVKDFVTSLYK